MHDIQSLSSTESLLELKNLRLALLSASSLPLASALHDAWSTVGYTWGCIWASPGPDDRATVLAVYPGPFAGVDAGTAVYVSNPGGSLAARPSLLTEPHPLLGLVRSFGLRQAASVPLYDGRDLVGGAFLARSGQFSIDEAFEAERLLRAAGRLVHSTVDAGVRTRGVATEQASGARYMGTGPEAWRDVIARLAHMLNNPLTSILGSSELLDEVDDLERQQLLALVKSEARRAGRLLRDALDFCTPPRVSVEVVEIGALIREVTRRIQPSLDERGISLHATLGDPVQVAADPRLFARALSLVLEHEWEGRGSGRVQPPELSLALTAGAATAELKISLAPLSLPENAATALWEPVDSSPQDRGDLRFDLPLARLLLSSQGISISSDYRRERERLEIRVSFPRVHPVAVGTGPSGPTTGITARLLIDSSPLRKLVELLLIREGVRVEQDSGGVRRADVPGVDLIVIDESWAQRFEAAPATSSQWNAEVRVMALGREIPTGLPPGSRVELLEKPFDSDTFRSVLNHVIGKQPGGVPEPQ